MFLKSILGRTWNITKSTITTKLHSEKTYLCSFNDIFPVSFGLIQHQTRQCSSYQISHIDNENRFLYSVLNSHVKSETHDVLSSLSKHGHMHVSITDEETFTKFLNKDWRNSTASDILNGFKTVKQFCVDNQITFSDPRFDKLVDGLMDHCEKLTDNQLMDLLNCISEYPGCGAYSSNNFHDMWSCLDDMCCWKMKNWDFDTKYKFADVWSRMKLAKTVDYVFEMLDKLVKKADKLTKDELLRIFYCFNTCRKRPVDYEYEYALQNKIQEMNVDEIAIVALGFFKTQSKIRTITTLEVMIEKVIAAAMGIHEISLSAIMKCLRYSPQTKRVAQVHNMLEVLCPELDRFSDMCILHIALLATGINTYQPIILRKCSQRLVENLHNSRLKEIERILFVLTNFVFDPQTKPDIFESALRELKKDSRLGEINKYPRSYCSAMHYLSLKGLYSYELLDRILNIEFLEMHFGKQPKLLPSHVFSLDICTDIECPDYTGNRLPPHLKYKAAKWNSSYAPTTYQPWIKLTPKDKLFLDVVAVVENIVGHRDLMNVAHVIPNYPHADIIICKDTKTDTFIDPKRYFQGYILGDVLRPCNDGSLKWYAIVVLNWHNNVKVKLAPLGHVAMKQRLLKRIGYNSVLVPWFEFQNLSLEEKRQYVLNQLI